MVFNNSKYQAPRNPPSIPYGYGSSRGRQHFRQPTPKPVYRRPSCTSSQPFQPWRQNQGASRNLDQSFRVAQPPYSHRPLENTVLKDVERDGRGDDSLCRDKRDSGRSHDSPKLSTRRDRHSPDKAESRSSSATSLRGQNFCPECQLGIVSLNGLKRHMLSKHAKVWSRDGVTRPATSRDLQQRNDAREKERLALASKRMKSIITNNGGHLKPSDDPTIRKRTLPLPAFGTLKSKRPCTEENSITTRLTSPMCTPKKNPVSHSTSPLLDFSPCSVDLAPDFAGDFHPIDVDEDDLPSVKTPLQTLKIQFNTGADVKNSQSRLTTCVPPLPVISLSSDSDSATSAVASFRFKPSLQPSPPPSFDRQLVLTSLGLDLSPTPCKDEKKNNISSKKNDSQNKAPAIISMVDSIIINGKSTFPGQVSAQPAPPPLMMLTQKNRARISREKVAKEASGKENLYDGTFRYNNSTTILGELGKLESTKLPAPVTKKISSKTSNAKESNKNPQLSVNEATTTPALITTKDVPNPAVEIFTAPSVVPVFQSISKAPAPDGVVCPTELKKPVGTIKVNSSKSAAPIKTQDRTEKQKISLSTSITPVVMSETLNNIKPVEPAEALPNVETAVPTLIDAVVPGVISNKECVLLPKGNPQMIVSAPTVVKKPARATKKIQLNKTVDATKCGVNVIPDTDTQTKLIPINNLYTNFIPDTDIEHFLLTQEQPWIVERVMKDAVSAFPFHHTMDILLRVSLYASSCLRSARYIMGESIKEVATGTPSVIRIPGVLLYDYIKINLFVSANLISQLDVLNVHPRRMPELNREKWSQAYHWANYAISQRSSPPYNLADVADLAEEGVSFDVAADRVMAFTSAVHAHRMVAEIFLSEANDSFPPGVHTSPLSTLVAYNITRSHPYGAVK